MDTRNISQKIEDLSEDQPFEEVECIYMDHIIKCFMVIFTNDHS
jgi:hypothetical protein